LLLVHGFLSSSAQWLANIDELSDTCIPVTAELWGHGNSPSPENILLYHPDHYASQFEMIRQALNIDQWFVCGYSLGAAFPMLALIFLGTKIRKNFSKGNTLTEFIYLKFGKKIFKLILILTIFYMFIFLCAEVTAITILVNYISGIPLWQTATVVIVSTLIYTLYGGLRASILTDNLQFFIVVTLLISSLLVVRHCPSTIPPS